MKKSNIKYIPILKSAWGLLFVVACLYWCTVNVWATSATLSGQTSITKKQSSGSSSYHSTEDTATAYAALKDASGDVTINVSFTAYHNCSRADGEGKATATFNGKSASVSFKPAKGTDGSGTENKTILLNVGSTPVSGNVTITLYVKSGIDCDQSGDYSEQSAKVTSVTYSGHSTHTYGSWTTVTPASHSAPGTEKRTCTVCGASETRAIPQIAHSYTITDMSHLYAPYNIWPYIEQNHRPKIVFLTFKSTLSIL